MSIKADHAAAGASGKAEAVLLFGLCILAGCASARSVVVEPGAGGIVAIPANTSSNREKAEGLMRSTCRGGYEIVREEEVAVGSRGRGERTVSRGTSDSITTREEFSTRVRYEWQIHYRCR